MNEPKFKIGEFLLLPGNHAYQTLWNDRIVEITLWNDRIVEIIGYAAGYNHPYLVQLKDGGRCNISPNVELLSTSLGFNKEIVELLYE